MTIKNNKWNGKITGLIIGMIMCLTLFISLIMFQRWMLHDTEKCIMVISIGEVPKGTTFTKDNVNKYFEEKEVSKSLYSKEAYTDIDSLIGKYAIRKISANEIVYQSAFVDEDNVLKNFKKPVEISLGIGNEAAAVAGTIRRGDYINIYTIVDKESKEYELVKENVLINDVYDTGMKKITATDLGTVAMSFTFYMEDKEVPELLNMLQDKDIYIAIAR